MDIKTYKITENGFYKMFFNGELLHWGFYYKGLTAHMAEQGYSLINNKRNN